MHLDGFKYWLCYTKGSKKYYRCSRSKSSKCPGRMIMDDTKIVSMSAHDHVKEARNSSVEKFRRVLTRKAAERPGKPLVDIYLEETVNHSEASILYPFSQAESTMRKARARLREAGSKCEGTSRVSDEIHAFSGAAASESYQNLEGEDGTSESQPKTRRKMTKTRKFFFTESHGNFTVVRMTQAALKSLGAIEELHITSDAKICENLYLVSTFAVVRGRECALAFGLLASNDSESLAAFLGLVAHKLISVTAVAPSVVLTNPCERLQAVVQSLFPSACVKTLYFYYARSALQKVAGGGAIDGDTLRRSSLKMILAMPLVPTNYIVPGFEALRKWLREKNVDLQNVCAHVYAQWLCENAEKVSIFNGLAHTVNCTAHSFVAELLGGLATAPPLSVVVERLMGSAGRSLAHFRRRSESSVKRAQKLEKTVKFATKSWISSPFHLRRPIQFLQQVSHCVDDAIIAFVRSYGAASESGNQPLPPPPPPPPLVYFSGESSRSSSRNATTELRPLPSEPPPLVLIRK